MNFKVGEDVVCITNKFGQVLGKPCDFEHPMKNEIVTIAAFKENWIQLEQYPTNNNGVPLFFSQDKFRKLSHHDLEAVEFEENYEIQG